MSVSDPQRTDAELLAAAGRGDVGAFEGLYFRHRDFVYRVALRFAREHEGAMDASQEVFAYLLRKLPGLRLTGKLSTYLYPIAKNIALTARQRGEHRLKLARENAARSEGATGPAIAGISSHLLAAVDALPDPQREVLLMRVVDEMTVEEVAVALGVPEGTVKSRLHHAIAALRANGDLGGVVGMSAPWLTGSGAVVDGGPPPSAAVGSASRNTRPTVAEPEEPAQPRHPGSIKF